MSKTLLKNPKIKPNITHKLYKKYIRVYALIFGCSLTPLTLMGEVTEIEVSPISEEIRITDSNTSEVKTYQPKIVEESKEKIQNFINYFIEVEKSPEDEDMTQAFPWRSFQASILSLKSPEAAAWIIETIPLWPDGMDQESLALMADKTAELANNNSITELISILQDQNIPMENKYWVVYILENIKDKDLLKNLQLQLNSLANNNQIDSEILTTIKNNIKSQ